MPQGRTDSVSIPGCGLVGGLVPSAPPSSRRMARGFAPLAKQSRGRPPALDCLYLPSCPPLPCLPSCPACPARLARPYLPPRPAHTARPTSPLPACPACPHVPQALPAPARPQPLPLRATIPGRFPYPFTRGTCMKNLFRRRHRRRSSRPSRCPRRIPRPQLPPLPRGATAPPEQANVKPVNFLPNPTRPSATSVRCQTDGWARSAPSTRRPRRQEHLGCRPLRQQLLRGFHRRPHHRFPMRTGKHPEDVWCWPILWLHGMDVDKQGNVWVVDASCRPPMNWKKFPDWANKGNTVTKFSLDGSAIAVLGIGRQRPAHRRRRSPSRNRRRDWP